MQNQEVQYLLKKYKEGTCTVREKALLESWYLQQGINGIEDLTNEQFVEDLTLIGKGLSLHETVHKSIWPRIAAAASILVFLSVSGYFIYHKQATQQIALNQIHDIAPGGDKAILRSHGKIFNINNAKNGLLTQQGNTTISKTADGQLAYNNKAGDGAMVYDTLIIPRGGQYRLKLADGTIAYLNADTKLRYPENFTGKERKVELISGEAYFEVVHNDRMPFRVVTTSQTVEDIGTHFNINAYENESVIKTTLLEGSVKIYKGNENTILIPGQQSQVNKTGRIKVITDADTEEAVAWKNGYFLVNDADMGSIMRQLERWYNIKVVFEGKTPTTLFHFKVSRNLSLVEMLKIFELNDINFKIEGRTLIVKS